MIIRSIPGMLLLLISLSGFSQTYTVKDGLSENVVHCLLQDSDGFLWIGTHEGLNRFNGYEFRKYLHDKDDSSSLPNSAVEGLFEYDKQHLLVRTSFETVLFNKKTGKFGPLDSSTMDLTNEVHAFFFGNMRKRNFILELFYRNTRLSTSIINRVLIDEGAIGFYYDATGRLWVLRNSSLSVIDKDGSEKIVLGDFYIPGQSKFNGLISDQNGHLWVRTPAQLFCIDLENLRLKATIEQTQVNDLSIANILTLLLDRTGVLWVGSFYGLKKINISHQKFYHFSKGASGLKLGSNFVLGLNILPGNRLTVQHFFQDSFYTELNFRYYRTRLYQIEARNLEKLLREVLVRQLDRASPKLQKEQIQKLRNRPYDWAYFRYAFTDREGIIWSFYNTNRLVNFHDDREISMNGGAEYLVDDDQFLWIATTKAGLWRYDKKSGEIKKYSHEKNKTTGISTDELLCLVENGAEDLWIGTRGGGLNHFNKKTETFTIYTQQDGLSNNTIYSMVMDDFGNLWLGTAHGLSYFNTRSKVFQNFYTSDGLINTEFNRWSAVKDSHGYIYMGGMNGIDYFKPEEVLQERSDILKIQVSDFRVGNRSLTYDKEVTLSYKENHISIEFAAMDFRNPETTMYQYMLEGASDEWISNGNDHRATFAALPPGKYVFRARAAAQSGKWSGETRLGFTILAPWWQTSWFYAACILFTSLILYSIYQFRINQLRKLYSVRSKISQDLHDEVGATLSSIHIYSSVASKAMNTDILKARQALEQINTNTRQVMENMSDIVWAMHTGNSGGISFENKLKNYGYELLTPLNIDCSYHISKDAEGQLTGIEARKNILLITKEALNNIAKHSTATKASIVMKTEGKLLLLEIADNGEGVHNKNNGHGLRNMESRARALGGNFQVKNANGTCLMISIPITSIRD